VRGLKAAFRIKAEGTGQTLYPFRKAAAAPNINPLSDTAVAASAE